jgi:hypothetical protein
LEDLFSFFEKPKYPLAFNAVRISLASPEKIRAWSYGEVKKPEKPKNPSSLGHVCCQVEDICNRGIRHRDSQTNFVYGPHQIAQEQ